MRLYALSRRYYVALVLFLLLNAAEAATTLLLPNAPGSMYRESNPIMAAGLQHVGMLAVLFWKLVTMALTLGALEIACRHGPAVLAVGWVLWLACLWLGGIVSWHLYLFSVLVSSTHP